MQGHGHFNVQRFDDIVVSTVDDSWNAETMEAYAAAFKAVVLDAGYAEGWGLVVDARRWRLATPEVGPMLQELSRWKDAQGLVASAYINDDNELKKAFATSAIGSGYLRSKMTIVDQPEQAFEWLLAAGLSIPLRLRQHFI
ncbi:MAG: hypothetical protein AAGE01_11395 [Pseudomonadota bacterium]